MKKNIKYFTAKAGIKKMILFVLLAILAISTNAQRSGLTIGIITNRNILDGKGGITPVTASLRKEVVREKVDLKNPQLENTKEKIVASDDKKPAGTKIITAPVFSTSGTVYDIPGTTSTNQYTSLQANFQFLYYDFINRSQSGPAGVIELYKLEKGADKRSFCIPSGGCASANIAIQITANGQVVTATGPSSSAAGTASGKSPLYLVVIPNGGYLQPGEYAFIDKTTLATDGSSIACFSFTVKQ